jgi:hypothetical protein
MFVDLVEQNLYLDIISNQIEDNECPICYQSCNDTLNITTHCSTRYCKKCGEYISTSKNINKPIHLKCRVYKYSQYQSQNYMIGYIGYHDLFRGGYISTHRHSDEYACPVFIYTKGSHQPHFQFDMKTKRIKFYRPNRMKIYDYDFMIIPEMLCPTKIYPFLSDTLMMDENIYLQYYLYLYITTQRILDVTPKMDYIAKFQKSSIADIVNWLSYTNLHRIRKINPFVLEFVYEHLRYAYYDENIYLKIIEKMDINYISTFHPSWMKILLDRYPKLLDIMSERTLKKFFKKHYNWFLTYVNNNPIVFDYINLYTKNENTNC